MTPSDLQNQLALIEAQLFASKDIAVIEAIDASQDAVEATERLMELGLTAIQARSVLDMPLEERTKNKRAARFAEADRLRSLL